MVMMHWFDHNDITVHLRDNYLPCEPPSTHARTHARTHSLTHSLTHARTHSLTHARTHTRTRGEQHTRPSTCAHARASARTHAQRALRRGHSRVDMRARAPAAAVRGTRDGGAERRPAKEASMRMCVCDQYAHVRKETSRERDMHRACARASVRSRGCAGAWHA
jgi:hypothetical protein